MLSPRALVSYHTDPVYMAPIEVSDDQVNCGPFFPDSESNGRVLSRKTPCGSYDIAEIVSSLPADQKPDLLVVKADATRSNFPRNIEALGIPAILILGDTQHQDRPLETMLQYALSERFTAYVSDHKRHHLHYFREAGLQNVHWAPGLNVKDWQVGFQREKSMRMAFVGQAGRHHPYRRKLIERLQSEPGIPFAMGGAPQKEASEIYAKTLINLNVSLNGDFNLRVFEVLAAGGFLLTDRLSSQAGLENLFLNGIHLVTYDGYEDLLAKTRYYLQHPQEALKIALQGHREFQRSHSPARKRRQLIDLAFKGWIDSSWNGERDRRSSVNRSRDQAHFFNRIRHYQRFQDAQLRREETTLLFTEGAEPALASDLADLHRTRLWSLAVKQQSYFERAGVERAVRLIANIDQVPLDAAPIHTLVTSAAEVLDGSSLRICAEVDPQELLVDNLTLIDTDRQVQVLQVLERYSFSPNPDFAGAFFVPTG